jgi:hypothetical protein
MNDNTIIRIKVPARLYESVKAKLMIKENFEAPVKEEAEELKESPVVDVIAALSGVLGLGLTGVAITKAQDLLKKKNPELFDKLQSAGAAMKNQGAGLNEDGDESLVKEDSRRGMDADTIDVVNRALKMIMQQINVEKDPQQRELLKKSTVDLGQISQWLQTKYARKGAEAMNEAKKLDPKKAAEDKKKAEEKKKKEAEAKKVADKKAADMKKAAQKKK